MAKASATEALRVSVVLPAYNEQDNIEALLKTLTENGDYEIIVVDDGSTDNTVKKVMAFPDVHLIRNPYNVGNGASVRKGIESSNGDIVVCMDADGQHDPADIPRLLEHVPQYDMVIASRLNNKRVSAFRSLGNWGLKRVAEMLSGHKIEDLTSGFRAMKREKISEFLHLFPTRYSYPTTSVLAFLSSGYTIKYVPLDGIQKRLGGNSSIQPVRDGLRFINITLRMIMLFNPQKIFVPISLLFLLVGVAWGIRSILLFNKIIQSAAVIIIASISIFLFGLLADQMSILIRRPRPPRQ